MTENKIQRVVIGAPFGNYLQFRHTTPTLGTFTPKTRGGFWKRLWRVLSTVRYYPGIDTWKNRLGLPATALSRFMADEVNVYGDRRTRKNPVDLSDKIVSVTAFTTNDWANMLDLLRNDHRTRPLAVELNVSCPNCPGEDSSDYATVFKTAAVLLSPKTDVIVKLPPLNYMPIVHAATAWGLRNFHCCNTLPTPSGGLSGKALKPHSLHALAEVRKYLDVNGYKPDILIGGGGVTSYKDLLDYTSAGATSVSVASALFFPWNWLRVANWADNCERWRPIVL
jgi:dihydroorotate dehydrogenase